MWMEEWDDIYRADFQDSPPSMQKYFARHAWYAPAARVGKWLPFSLYEMVRGTGFGIGISSRNVLSGLLLFVLALWAHRYAWSRSQRWYLNLMVLLFLLFFAWYYPIGGIPIRFFLPITFLVFLLAGQGLAVISFGCLPLSGEGKGGAGADAEEKGQGGELGRKAAARWGSPGVQLPLAAVCLGLTVLLYARSFPSFSGPSRVPHLWEAVVAHSEHRATWVLGPDPQVDFVWMLPEQVTRRDWLYVQGFAEQEAYVRKIGAEYLVVSSGLDLQRTGLEGLYRREGGRLARTARPLPAGWELVGAGRDGAFSYLLYRHAGAGQ
jgi:hypothetical protein